MTGTQKCALERADAGMARAAMAIALLVDGASRQEVQKRQRTVAYADSLKRGAAGPYMALSQAREAAHAMEDLNQLVAG